MKEHRLKAEIYDLLALGFLYPSADRIEATTNGYFDAVEEKMAELGLGCEPSSYFCADETALEREKEYTRLFVNAFPKVVTPPYGSVYLEEKGLVWGESTSGIVRLYVAAGVEITEDFHDIPDHIAAELSFASYLQRSIDAGFSEHEGHYRILMDEHLGRWGPEFLRKVTTETSSDFYRKLAGVTKLFIDREVSSLKKV